MEVAKKYDAMVEVTMVVMVVKDAEIMNTVFKWFEEDKIREIRLKRAVEKPKTEEVKSAAKTLVIDDSEFVRERVKHWLHLS